MSAAQNLNVADLPTGPDLLLRNAFRLAQMSVDTSDRQLSRRHKRIERAINLGTEIPRGELPIFTADGLSDNPDELKDALHRIGDPVRRLVDELFWFWPATFGDGNTDAGLQLVADNKIDEAVKLWREREKDTENFVSTHNLALLYQFQALQKDDRRLSDPASDGTVTKGLFGLGGDKADRTTRKQWHESLRRWQLLTQQDSFWAFLRNRIREMDDPRLPVEFADWLRERLPLIVLSINVGLVLKAAQRNLGDQVSRQKQILDDSGFDAELVDSAYASAAERYRERVVRMGKLLGEDVERNAIEADSMIRSFHDQASPLLDLLGQLHPEDDRGIRALHDEVATAMRSALVKFCRKTEDWDAAHSLALQAKELAKSDKVVTAISGDIEAIEENRGSDSSWCKKGYFDLPADCLALLEEARELASANRFDDAIDVLRGALTGRADVPDAAEFGDYLMHCLVCSLRDKAWHCRSQGIDEFNAAHARLINESVQYNGYFDDSTAACSGCGHGIYGQFTIRTISGVQHPFCSACNGRIVSRVEALDRKLDPSLRTSLNLVVLADHLLSGSKSTHHALEVMRKEAAGRTIAPADPETLKTEMGLRTASELIDALGEPGANTESAGVLYSRLSRVISQQSDARRERTLNALFEVATASTTALRTLLPVLFTDSFVFSKFIRLAISSNAPLLIDALRKVANHALKLEIVDLINRQHTSPEALTTGILETLTFDVASLVEAGGLESFDDGDLADLLKRVSGYHVDGLEERLIVCAIQTYFSVGIDRVLAPFLRAVHASSRVLPVFYGLLCSESENFSQDDRLAFADALKRSTDPCLQFSVLQQLAEVAPGTALLSELEAGISEAVVNHACAELRASAGTWKDGYVASAVSYAMAYRKDFSAALIEKTILAMTANASGKKFRVDCGKLLVAVSVVREDLQLLLDLISGQRAGLNVSARKTLIELMAAHWDGSIRLLGLQHYVEYMDDQSDSATDIDKQLIVALIRFLADENDAVRTFAFEQLQRRPDGLLAFGLPAVASTDASQRGSLSALLEAIDPPPANARNSTSLDSLMRLVGVTTEPAILRFLTRRVDAIHASHTGVGLSRETIGLCKFLVDTGTALQQQAAQTVLRLAGPIRRWRLALLEAVPGDTWWTHEVLQAPSDITEAIDREPRDAREDLTGQGRHVPVSASLTSTAGLRKAVVKLARDSAEQPFTTCPVCQASVRPKNLVRHYDKVHKDASADATNTPRISAGSFSLDVEFPLGSIARPIGGQIWPVLNPIGEKRPTVAWLRPALLSGLLACVAALHLTDNPTLKRFADSGVRQAVLIAQHPVWEQAVSQVSSSVDGWFGSSEGHPPAVRPVAVALPAPPDVQPVDSVRGAIYAVPSAAAQPERSSRLRGRQPAPPPEVVSEAEQDACGAQPTGLGCRDSMQRDAAGIPLRARPGTDRSTAPSAAAESALAVPGTPSAPGSKAGPVGAAGLTALKDALANAIFAEERAAALAARVKAVKARAARAWVEAHTARRRTDREPAAAQVAEARLLEAQAAALADRLRNLEAQAAKARAQVNATMVARARAARVETAKVAADKTTTVKKTRFNKNDTRELQRRLAQLGYKPGPVDGLWGGKTRRAMQAFQRARGLVRTTQPNMQTLRAIRRLTP